MGHDDMSPDGHRFRHLLGPDVELPEDVRHVTRETMTAEDRRRLVCYLEALCDVHEQIGDCIVRVAELLE